MSWTVTEKPQELVLPLWSVAVQVSVVTPKGKVDPDGGTHATVITDEHASETVGLKETSAPDGPVHSAVWLLGHVIVGGVVSCTVMVTVSVSVPPLPSSTVSVIIFAARGNVTVGVAPLAVPNESVQVNVKGSLSGSLEPVPETRSVAI